MSSRFREGVGTAFCGTVLTVLNALLLFATFTMVVVWLFDAADPSVDIAENRDVTLFLLLCALIVAGLTWVFVKAEWLRSWWYALPVLSGGLALLRLAV